MHPKRKQKQPNPDSKLSFRKTAFRVLDQAEMSEAKGGTGDMVLGAEMVLAP